jgi:hypothetical protein
MGKSVDTVVFQERLPWNQTRRFGSVLSLFLVLTMGIPVAHAENPTPQPGRQDLFTQRCGACHSVYPPPLKAPPALGIARNYRGAVANEDEFVDRIVAFVTAPSQSKSLMPPGAVARFGLMPPLPLPREELESIARWMWKLAPGQPR